MCYIHNHVHFAQVVARKKLKAQDFLIKKKGLTSILRKVRTRRRQLSLATSPSVRVSDLQQEMEIKARLSSVRNLRSFVSLCKAKVS
jgi:hypothetical protein